MTSDCDVRETDLGKQVSFVKVISYRLVIILLCVCAAMSVSVSLRCVSSLVSDAQSIRATYDVKS